MQVQKIISMLILSLVGVGLSFVFYYTKVSPLTFVYGAAICLIVEIILLLVYCIYKIHKVYRQSRTIILKRNSSLDPSADYLFEKIEAKQYFYFNSYTNQAKYLSHKNKIKMMQPAHKDDLFFQEVQIEEPKKDIMHFLKEIQSYYNSLNIFTDVLINFGRNLKFIQKSTIFQKRKFYFSKFEQNYPPEYPFYQMRDREMKVFQNSKTLPLLSKGHEKILFPRWGSVVNLMKYIGIQFQKIEQMRRSNSQMLQMIHKKVLQDFSLLQKRLFEVGKQLNYILKNLKEMRKDYTKYQDAQINNIEDTNQLHLQMMHWVKKQYYEFRDLEKRIKQSQNALKERSVLRKHLQKKLSQFRHVSQKAFMKTVKTRYIALLDSYHITVDESMKQIQQCLRSYHFDAPPPRPKIKQYQLEKNMNDALETARNYQKEYFQRTAFFLRILEGCTKSIQSLGEFIQNLKDVFEEMINNLKASHLNKYKMASYFTELTKALLQRSVAIHTELCQLSEVNLKFQNQNSSQIELLFTEIRIKQRRAYTNLSDINLADGIIKHKLHSAHCQNEQIYQQIEQKLKKIEQFESFYLLHSGRVKKIILIEFLDFLNYQRQFIAIGNIRSQFNSNAYGLIEDIMSFDQSEHEEGDGKAQGDRFDFDDGLYATNPDLSPNYIKLINQFLFVSFSEWKTSNFFKQQILQELFIAFNKDPNESFSKIEVSEMQFYGVPPEVIWIKMLKSDDKQAFFDVNLAFKGGIKLKVNTIYKLIRDIPVEVTIEITQFYCVMRFCFVPSNEGQGWFSFIGQPISKFKIVPSIANYRFDIQSLRAMVNNFLTSKLKKKIYPIKQKISVPASKKDDDLLEIQKRFRALDEADTFN